MLKIDGLPIDNASTSISREKELSRLLDSFQDTTYRLYQFKVAARYMNPFRMGM